ncbi:hypothetical protein [Rouxiella chamberiensis]|uniref:Uncharacterized protein n=1 Tax=Rouxiella chamberiensis TaxID=1513468 RepID=A0ABY7HR18_9GAMM|nr:hypothetical protein [Rouxiella chamberiensis]WAT01673.1 hypothetical protein O1V66_02640 [Rouxiella chamberiensis]
MNIKNASNYNDILATIGSAASSLIMDRKALSISDITLLLEQNAEQAYGSSKDEYVEALELIASKMK